MRRLCFGLVCGLALVAGCTDDAPEYPQTVPVTGTITQGGKPVEGANVTYVPTQQAPTDGTTNVYAANGTTGPDGKYTLSTYFSPSSTGAGVVPGSYNVTVTKAPPVPASTPGSEHGDHASAPAAPAGPKSLLPKQYADPTGTPLRTTIEAGQPHEDSFDLK